MGKRLLGISVLGAALGLSLSVATASPAPNMLERLKASASEGSAIEQVAHRRKHRHARKHRKLCWWGDRWLCRHFW